MQETFKNGKGGKTWEARQQANKVRGLVLSELQEILEDKTYQKYTKDYREQILLKLATTALPRINEHSGPDGGAIEVSEVDLENRLAAKIAAIIEAKQ